MKIKYGRYSITMLDYVCTEIYFNKRKRPTIYEIKTQLEEIARQDAQFYEKITEIENNPEECKTDIFGEWLFSESQLIFTGGPSNSILIHYPAEHRIISFMKYCLECYYENPEVADMKDRGNSMEYIYGKSKV